MVFGIASALALAGCSAAPQPQAKNGPTIVSLNPCLDAILVEVARPEQIGALSHYSHDPASSSIAQNIARKYPVTGGTAEEIIAINPDLVLASTFIAPATKAALEKAGLRVETFGSPASVDESTDQVSALAQLIGREDAGRQLVDRISASLALPDPSSRPITALLWQPGEIVAGDASLIWDQLRHHGLSNHAADMGLGQADRVSLEAVLADPPQLLLIAGGAAGQSHPLLDRLADTHVVQFDPSLFYCGGPSIIEAGRRLNEIQEGYASRTMQEVAEDAG
ncbi:MAG: ABC transporter substrate-binding protein [Pseudomonadota bacterium]|nr:ABC transporter substrate-binding protein [Pseudomonadota bacterium]